MGIPETEIVQDLCKRQQVLRCAAHSLQIEHHNGVCLQDRVASFVGHYAT